MAAVPILCLGPNLVATLSSDLTDKEWDAFVLNLLEMIGRGKKTGVVIDLSALELVDSFACRVITTLVIAVRLLGAGSVVVGIAPAVAFSLVQLGLSLDGVMMAIDLDEGIKLLAKKAQHSA